MFLHETLVGGLVQNPYGWTQATVLAIDIKGRMLTSADHTRNNWMPMQDRKISDIESLRGLAILLVLVSHLPMLMPWGYETYQLTSMLQLGAGVDLFFAISGYVISRSIYKDIAETHGQGKSVLLRFWVRRFFRLIPAAVLVVLATLLTVWLFSDVTIFKFSGSLEHTAYGAIAALTQWFNLWGYLQVSADRPLTLLAHYWSLSLEEQFYIVWPLLVVFLPGKRWLIMVAILGMIVISAFPRSDNTDWAWWFRIDAVLWGCLIYLLLPHLGKLHQMLCNRGLAWALLLLGLVLLIASAPFLKPAPSAGTVTSFGAMLCGLVAVVNRDMLQNLGGLTSALNYLGSRSYTIYLWHILIYMLVKTAWMSAFPGIEKSASLWGSALVLLSLLPFAAIIEFSYRVVEDRTRKAGRRLSDRLATRDPGG